MYATSALKMLVATEISSQDFRQMYDALERDEKRTLWRSIIKEIDCMDGNLFKPRESKYRFAD